MNIPIKQPLQLALFSVLWFAASSTQASLITMDLSSYNNANYDNDYLIRSYGSNPAPSSPLGGIPFDLPSTGDNFYLFSGNNSQTPEVLSLNTSVNDVVYAYLLLNTNWGVSGFRSGTVEFNTSSESYTVDLIAGTNIRDWNNMQWANTTTDPNSQEVYSIDSSRWGTPARLDMLTVALPSTFIGDTLASVVISDFGWEFQSNIRFAGITFETRKTGGGSTPIPEPGSVVLMALGLAGLGFSQRRRSAHQV